jgi:hypothetical protein
MKLILILCLFSFQLSAANGSVAATLITYEFTKLEESAPPTPLVGLSHAPLDAMLRKYVSTTGKVDYASFKNDPTIARYLGMLESATPSAMGENEEKAFWINVYNIYTIKLIIDNKMPKSIKDIGSPWDRKFIKIAGETYSLNQVENEILRPKFKDARIHFAINCASVSCPKLHNAAFTASNIEAKLEQLAREFVNDSAMNELSAGRIKISNIFDWYGVDFKQSGTVIDWLNQYSDVTINADAKIGYKNYNWDLNIR